MKLVTCIGDLHFPYHSKGCATWIADKHIPKHKPKVIVVMGDLYDYISFSRFPKRITITPRDECVQARETAEEYFRLLKKRAPKSKIFLIRGNHDERLIKHVVAKAPELEHLIDYKSLWEFNGVETIHSPKEVLDIEGIKYTHGHKKHGTHLAEMDYPRGVVHGHDHRGQITWSRIGRKNKLCFEAGTGFVGDPFNEHLVYRPLNKYFKWTLGVMNIEEGIPIFYPWQEK